MPLRRRDLLQAGVWRGTGALALGLVAQGQAAAPALAALPSEERLRVCQPAGDPLQELLARNGAFCRAWRAAEASPDPQARVQALQAAWPQRCQVRPDALATGQRPWAAVLACADSRVAPEWLFACGPGELFEVRSAGNTAFDAGVASLEYAVAELAVPLILVLGHSGCGAVTAAMARAPLTPLLEELVLPIRASLRPGLDLAAAVRANALHSAAELPRRSALLAEAVTAGQLRIAAAVVEIGSGRVGLV
jgi:carbonic anhydrase